MSGPMTMRDRESAADDAMLRDIDKARANHEILMVHKSNIPEGAKLMECYETETQTEWVICGEPWPGEDETDPRYHDCDAMGCCSLSHVVARIEKPKRGDPKEQS